MSIPLYIWAFDEYFGMDFFITKDLSFYGMGVLNTLVHGVILCYAGGYASISASMSQKLTY